MAITDFSLKHEPTGPETFGGLMVPVDGTSSGDVLTSQGDGAPAEWQPAGGGSQPGVSIVRRIPFAFDTPGLSDGTGAPLYVPTIGDILLDAWLEIDTDFDGTTPFGDLGCLAGAASHGLFYNLSGEAVPMDQHDGVSFNQTCLSQGKSLNSIRLVEPVVQGTSDYNGLYAVNDTAVDLISGPISGGSRMLPAKFVTADPLSVWVTQDGSPNGADPGSSAGAAALCLVTATPSAT